MAGHDFDIAYCDMMVKGHQDAIDKYDQASTSTHDEDVKTLAESVLPTLRNHLDHAIACQAKCDTKK